MRASALVVGCEAYRHLPADTSGSAIADALAMRSWMLAAGGLQPADLRLLLSPAPDPAGNGLRVDGPADLECFADQLRRLLTTGTGDRLYVYIAARGCSSDSGRPYLGQSLILLSDFDPTQPRTGSLAVEELAAHLAHADFREVVTVLDCGPGVPVDHRLRPAGLGGNWQGRRRSGAAMQFRIEAPAADASARRGRPPGPARGALTAAFLSAVAPAGPVGTDRDVRTEAVVRWSSLEQYLVAALPSPPVVSGPDPGMTLTPAASGSGSDGGADSDSGTGFGEAASAAAGGDPRTDSAAAAGDVELHCADPNAMLAIEDGSGLRQAVGVGSISGHLPAGSYTALLADPSGADPRVSLTVTPFATASVVLAPRPRSDGFRVTDEPALLWSSPAAQLAMATSSLWAYGHQSYLLVGGAPALPGADLLLDGHPDRFAHRGSLTAAGAGWWVALPVTGPWHTVGVHGSLLTVPAAPDSVSAVAISPSSVSVALFDTTHPEPVEIAAQDRVQEYLGIGRLGAADLTSRSSVPAGQRWPWGASAAVRRLIDRTRASRAGEVSANEHTVEPGPGPPPHQFRADVPPVLRRLLVGRGPWAVWLDWPGAATSDALADREDGSATDGVGARPA